MESSLIDLILAELILSSVKNL